MQATFYPNNVLESQQNNADFQAKSTEVEQCFDHREVLQFWNQLNVQEKEEILMLKECHIIEAVAKGLNDFNFITCVNAQFKTKSPINRTVLCKRKGRSGLIVSILELDYLCVDEADSKENIYFNSLVILLFKGYEDINSESQPKLAYQIVEEEEMQVYICNLELLEKHGALLKIKASKLEMIIMDFVIINHDFCHGSKRIVPDNQYWNHFTQWNQQATTIENQAKTKTKGVNVLNIRLKPKVYLTSALKLFENNLLLAYLKNLQTVSNENQFVENGWTPQHQEDEVWQQSMENVQEYNDQQYHFQHQHPHQQMGNALTYPPKHYEQGYYPYYNNPYGHMPPQHTYHEEISDTALIPVANGVYFGKLDFIIRDQTVEEKEFGIEQPALRRPRTKTDYVKQSNEFFGNRYKGKRHYTSGYDSNHYQRPFAPNYHQQEQSADPLQQLLGKTNLQNQPQSHIIPSGQTLKNNNPTFAIPLLETIIKLPTAGNANSQINLNPTPFPLNQNYVGPQRFMKPSEGATGLPDHFSNNSRQDELEVSTTISIGSMSRMSDKDSLGEPYRRYPKYPNKNKFRTGNNAKFQAGGYYRKDWDHRSPSNQTSDTQSRKLSDISQNFENSTAFEFPNSSALNDHSKNSSKDKI